MAVQASEAGGAVTRILGCKRQSIRGFEDGIQAIISVCGAQDTFDGIR